MRPTPANEALSAWLDGELDEAAIGEIEAELARDPSLREDLQMLEGVVRTLRDEGPVAAPVGFEDRVMARIAAESPEAFGGWAWLRRPFGIPLEGWALGLAAVAVLLLLLPVWRGTPDEGEAARQLSPAAVEPPRTKEPLVDPAGALADEAPDPPEGTAEGVDERIEKQRSVDFGTRKSAPGPVPVPTGPVPGPVSPETAVTAEGTASEAVALGPEAHQLLVQSGSATVKRDLLKICGRYYWRCDAAGRSTDSKMRSSRETVMVTLPQSDLALLVQELASMGHEVQRIGGAALMKGSTVEVPVVLQLVGGASRTEQRHTAPPAVDSLESMEAGEAR